MIIKNTIKMQLTQNAINAIKASTRVKSLLAVELGKSGFTIERWIRENDDNLTKAAALKVIREEFGLSDSEILEETQVVA